VAIVPDVPLTSPATHACILNAAIGSELGAMTLMPVRCSSAPGSRSFCEWRCILNRPPLIMVVDRGQLTSENLCLLEPVGVSIPLASNGYPVSSWRCWNRSLITNPGIHVEVLHGIGRRDGDTIGLRHQLAISPQFEVLRSNDEWNFGIVEAGDNVMVLVRFPLVTAQLAGAVNAVVMKILPAHRPQSWRGSTGPILQAVSVVGSGQDRLRAVEIEDGVFGDAWRPVRPKPADVILQQFVVARVRQRRDSGCSGVRN